MKIGYPCINRSVGCTANSTFRLANYSEARLINCVSGNLECLQNILEYNIENGILFFRMSSDIVPFASHPVCMFDWESYFGKTLCCMGEFIKKHEMRISMHPDQFVLLNALKSDIVERSIAELDWHCRFLDALELDSSAKVQIHVGGLYGDRPEAIARFVSVYKTLPKHIKKRLVIENDDKLFTLSDCLEIHELTGSPVLFDNFHHVCNSNGMSYNEAWKAVTATWKKHDGIPMSDYSSQEPGAKKGKHAEHIDIKDFSSYLKEISSFDFDIMLEIKDKEKSAIEALAAARKIREINI